MGQMMTRRRLLLITFLALTLCILPSLASGQGSTLQYCILSHERIAQNGFRDFVVDYLLSQRRDMQIRLFKAEDDQTPLRSWTLQPTAQKPHIFRWDGLIKGQMTAPGGYLLRFEVKDEPPQLLHFEVTSPEESLPLAVSEEALFLPQSLDDANIWNSLSAPVAVVDIGATAHQSLWDKPGKGAKEIGTVHGQTAGVKIIQLDIDGYALVGAYATQDGAYVEGYIDQSRLKMVRPQTRYGLLIDKNAQTMTVYEAGKKLGIVSVSTGLMEKNRLYQETRAGTFLTQDRQLQFNDEGFFYDYAIRIDGGNLIHQAGYKRVLSGQDFSGQISELGAKASHGCVRVDSRTSPQGLDAFWLFTHLPRNTKVLVLDDPAARQMLLAQIGATPTPRLTAVPTPAPSPTPVPPENAQVKLTFMGDCVIGSEEKSRKLPISFDSYVDQKGFAWPFSAVQDILSRDDLSVINFEGVLKDNVRDREPNKQHWFRGPSSFTQVLTEGSIELTGLANNHVSDYGAAGRKSTRQALEGVGIPNFGYSRLHIFEKDGIRIGFGGIRETTFKQDKNIPAGEIAELKAHGAHFIVYTCHFGEEYQPVNGLQREMARAVIDAGADIVVGAHSHTVQGIERYKKGLIVYSLGNFIFGGNLELSTFDGLMAGLTLDFKQQQLSQAKLTLIPVLTSGIRPANDFRPVIAQGEDKARILAAIQAQSEMTIGEEILFGAGYEETADAVQP
jgi:lipoprotein-anchoring transpeptidase ErfK/SrfK